MESVMLSFENAFKFALSSLFKYLKYFVAVILASLVISFIAVCLLSLLGLFSYFFGLLLILLARYFELLSGLSLSDYVASIKVPISIVFLATIFTTIVAKLLFSFFLTSWVQVKMITFGIKSYFDKKVTWEDVFSLDFKKVLKATFALILIGVIVMLGLILFIIPGIYFGLKYSLVTFIIVDQDLSILESLKESARLTYGYKWRLLLYWLLLVFIIFVVFSLAGLLLSVSVTGLLLLMIIAALFFVGCSIAIITVPILIYTHIYKQLLAFKDSKVLSK